LKSKTKNKGDVTVSQEPDWMQDGISAEEYFEKHFSSNETNFLLEENQKPQKKKTSLNDKLIIITLVFMFAFCGWLIYENTTQRKELSNFKSELITLQDDYAQLQTRATQLQKDVAKYNVLQEDYDELIDEFESLSTKYNKTESQMLKYKKQIEDSVEIKTSSTQKENSGFRDVTNKIVNNANKNNSSENNSTSSSTTQNIPYKQNYHGAVYITPTGECYHYESPCGRGTYYKSTWAVVNQRGLRPCEKCVMH
jgi:DNA repair exonuclease SbcCD ATPase subunit